MASVTTSTLVLVDHAPPATNIDPNLASIGEIAVALNIDSAAVSTATSKMVSTASATAPDSVSLSTVTSKAQSSGTQASVADSKSISGSVNTSVADSKAGSNSVNTSVADSKATSVGNATVVHTLNGIPAFQQNGVGAVVRSANTKMAERLTPEDFNATGDGTTDNATAFGELAAYVNGITGSKVPVIEFLSGEYRYTNGLTFTREVHLAGGGTWLNYAGTGRPISLGPDGLDGASEKSHRRYEIEDLGFRNGALMSQGIYVNSFLTQPRFRKLRFDAFGNANAWAIFFQSSNWNAHVIDCSFSTNSDSTGDRNFVRLHGAASDGTVDEGQSRLTMLHCLATNQGFGAGTAVYVNGKTSLIANNKIESFGANIWLAAFSAQTVIDNNYFETRYGPCIQYGDATGLNVGAYAQDLRISNNRCNLHKSDFRISYPFIGPTTSNTGMQYLRLRDNVLDDADPDVPMVVQNSDKASQTDNRASGNRGYTILHTAGVPDWTGEDGP